MRSTAPSLDSYRTSNARRSADPVSHARTLDPHMRPTKSSLCRVVAPSDQSLSNRLLAISQRPSVRAETSPPRHVTGSAMHRPLNDWISNLRSAPVADVDSRPSNASPRLASPRRDVALPEVISPRLTSPRREVALPEVVSPEFVSPRREVALPEIVSPRREVAYSLRDVESTPEASQPQQTLSVKDAVSPLRDVSSPRESFSPRAAAAPQPAPTPAALQPKSDVDVGRVHDQGDLDAVSRDISSFLFVEKLQNQHLQRAFVSPKPSPRVAMDSPPLSGANTPTETPLFDSSRPEPLNSSIEAARATAAATAHALNSPFALTTALLQQHAVELAQAQAAHETREQLLRAELERVREEFDQWQRRAAVAMQEVGARAQQQIKAAESAALATHRRVDGRLQAALDQSLADRQQVESECDRLSEMVQLLQDELGSVQRSHVDQLEQQAADHQQELEQLHLQQAEQNASASQQIEELKQTIVALQTRLNPSRSECGTQTVDFLLPPAPTSHSARGASPIGSEIGESLVLSPSPAPSPSPSPTALIARSFAEAQATSSQRALFPATSASTTNAAPPAQQTTFSGSRLLMLLLFGLGLIAHFFGFHSTELFTASCLAILAFAFLFPGLETSLAPAISSCATDEAVINADGCLSVPSVDSSANHATSGKSVHYCGRHVGTDGYHTFCGSCTGDCGPAGCQCRACYLLDQPELLNDEGAIARLAANPASHSNGACLHYCGRRAEYHNPCSQCDGQCGPGGCQCRSCYRLDFARQQ